MKVKRGLAILLSSVMVVQMSVMAFAAEDPFPNAGIISLEGEESGKLVESEENGGEVDKQVGGEEGSLTATYTATPNSDAGFSFSNWSYTLKDSEDLFRNPNQTITFEQSDGLLDIIAYFIKNYTPASEPEPAEEQNDNTPAPVQNEEPKVPEEPDTTGQINIVDTSAGNALPTAELGDAIASTRTLSLNICNISPRQYSKAVQDTVAKTPEGGNIVIETNQVSCFDKNMMAAFAKKSSVNIFVVFKNKAGKKVLVTIPAGYDVMSLLDDNGYCGFMHLADVFGSREL